jgi:hypothetical protein
VRHPLEPPDMLDAGRRREHLPPDAEGESSARVPEDDQSERTKYVHAVCGS